MNDDTKVSFRTHLFWHIMFIDCLVLALHYGGLGIADFLFHGFCLLLASAVLITQRTLHGIPKSVLYCFGTVLLLGLLQMIPLPEAALPWLAPVKWRVAQISQGLFPDYQFTTSITMIPQLHAFKLAVFALDAYTVLLLCLAPAPSSKLPRFWLVALAVPVSILAILSGKQFIIETSLLSPYMGTYGGLVNQNHYACFAVLLGLPLMAQTFQLVRDSIRTYLHVKPVPVNLVAHKVVGACGSGIIMCLCFAGFRYSYSRSGIVDLVLAIAVFGFTMARGSSLQPRRWGLLAILFLIMITVLTLPLGKGLDKFQELGWTDSKRADYLSTGLFYLREYPVLGLGLGSSEEVMNQIAVKGHKRNTSPREFHNDFLQTLVELGPIGLICLLVFCTWILREILATINEKRYHQKVMGATLLGLLVMLCFHSLVSFPLRITSIRLLTLILFFLFIKDTTAVRRTHPRVIWMFCPILILALLHLATLIPKMLAAPLADSHMEEQSLKYARHFRTPRLQAGERLTYLFNNNLTAEETLQEIPHIRQLVLTHLYEQSYGVRGLNMLFMLEVLENRINHPEYDREVYLIFKEKARLIGELGNDANADAQGPWLFLFGTYEAHLDEPEKAEFERLKQIWRHQWYYTKRRLLK